MKFWPSRTSILIVFCLLLSGLASASGTLLGTISWSDMSDEAKKTWALIQDGGPFPDSRDGQEFENRNNELPRQPQGYYHEYLVKAWNGRVLWDERIVAGGSGSDKEYFYTDNNFENYHHIQE